MIGLRSAVSSVLEQLLKRMPVSNTALPLVHALLTSVCCCYPAGAYTSYMSALAAYPSHISSLMSLAALYKSRGLLCEARATLAKALEVSPDDTAVKEAMAVVLTDLGTNMKVAGGWWRNRMTNRMVTCCKVNVLPFVFGVRRRVPCCTLTWQQAPLGLPARCPPTHIKYITFILP